jgi:hypothetical protein
MKTVYRLTPLLLLVITLGIAATRPVAQQQFPNPVHPDSVHTDPAHPNTVLVELFTSEGCSDCPPADDLLKQIHLQKTSAGQLIIGISEHVTYWNRLGWTDPFSSEQYTARQNDYSAHFGLDSVYTPQMVVNGREQFIGSDRRALQAAFLAEAQQKQIALHIESARLSGKNVVFTYSANDLPAKSSFDLIAVLVDDMDRSSVKRGENSGRDLVHVSVARAMKNLGRLQPVQGKTVTFPLSPSFTAGAGNHLVLFAQQTGTGAVIGADTAPL